MSEIEETTHPLVALKPKRKATATDIESFKVQFKEVCSVCYSAYFSRR